MQRLSWTVCALLAALPAVVAYSQMPEVAPGIALPATGDATVFALDKTAAGPSLVHIKPDEVMIDTHAVVNLLGKQVFIGPHQGAVLPGARAAVQIESPQAVFFVRLAGEDAEIAKTRVHLLWLDSNKKEREVAELTNNVWGGQHRRYVYEVPSSTQMIEGSNWLKVTPNEPLLSGEFAIVFLAADVNQPPTSAFDFGVAGDGKQATESPYVAKSPVSTPPAGPSK